MGKNGLKETPLKLEHPVAGDNVGVYLRPKGTDDVTRVRHYTNRKGSKGIENDGVIRAQDNNRVYVEPANKKPLNQVKAETKYQLKPGRGRDFIEFDVPTNSLEWISNPRYGTPELTIKGDVNISNGVFTRRK